MRKEKVSEVAASINDRNSLFAAQSLRSQISSTLGPLGQPLHHFSSCSAFELCSDKHPDVKRLIKEGERRGKRVSHSESTPSDDAARERHTLRRVPLHKPPFAYNTKKGWRMSRSWTEEARGRKAAAWLLLIDLSA